jgi:hypothetical protein
MEPSQWREVDVTVSALEANSSREAQLTAWADVQFNQGVMAPIYLVVSSVQARRSRGGWTVCFKLRKEPRAVLRKKTDVLKQLGVWEDYVKRNKDHQEMAPAVEAVKQRVWALEWVLSRRDSF